MNLEVNGNDTGKTLQGGDGEDILSANGNAKANTLQGGNGNDELNVFGNASSNTLQGGGGIDKLRVYGNASANIVQGGKDNDELRAYGNASFNTLQGGDGEDMLWAYDNANANTLQGGDGNDMLRAKQNAKANTLQGGDGNDTLFVDDNASGNTLQGGEDSDGLHAYGNASGNTLQGGDGKDTLSAENNASGNTLQGDDGEDGLYVYGNASGNTLQGDDGEDGLWARGDAKANTLQGGDGNDTLYVYDNASGNTLQGGKDSDGLHAFDNAHNNILQGGGGSDTFYVYGNASGNTLQGGEDQDTIISIARYSNILQGDAGDDFILNYAPDPSQQKELSLAGGTGQDILIGAGMFWQPKAETTEDTDTGLWHDKPSIWHFDAGGDDDVIVPYLPLDNLALGNLAGKLTNNETTKLKAFGRFVSTTTPCDITYDIVTGDGQDIVLLNSRPAEHTTTIIQDFDVGTDKLYFDDQAMAETFAAHIAFAKTFALPTVLIDYKGHQYDIRLTSAPLKPTLKTIDVDGIKLEYPDFDPSVTPGLMQQNYTIYDQITLSNRLQTTAYRTKLNRSLLNGIATGKTLSQAYTLDLDHDIFVTTQATLDLTTNDKGGFTTKARDLFMQEQDHRTTLYTSLSTTADKSCSYYDNIPDHIVGVVVVQEQNSGLVFTTGSAEDVAKLSLPEQTIQTFAARDFFSRGHFAKMNPTADQANLSVTMKIGLIYKDQGKIITTALSDPITIKAAR